MLECQGAPPIPPPSTLLQHCILFLEDMPSLLVSAHFWALCKKNDENVLFWHWKVWNIPSQQQISQLTADSSSMSDTVHHSDRQSRLKRPECSSSRDSSLAYQNYSENTLKRQYIMLDTTKQYKSMNHSKCPKIMSRIKKQKLSNLEAGVSGGNS